MYVWVYSGVVLHAHQRCTIYTLYNTSFLCVQGLKGQLTREFKQSFALLVDKNAPRPSDALSDID